MRVAKALGDPMRFRILGEIARRGEVSCRELTEAFPISQPTISHHLKILSGAGLVAARRAGAFHLYRTRPDALDTHRATLAELVAPAREGTP